MVDPFSILAQQANQTADLFRAIDANTQQVFANKFNVQEAETRLALNVAQQTEQYRMNDAKLAELEQSMRMKNQQMEWQAKEEAFKDRVRPLQFKTQELLYENQFLQRTEQQLKPFMGDLNPILADLTFTNPELATEAQTKYQTLVYEISQKALRDPTLDIQKELEIKKEEIKKWANEKKLTNKSSVYDDLKFGKSLVGAGEIPTWMKNIESSSVTEADPEVVARAAGIYKQFGGSDVEFLKKHDKQYGKLVDSVFDISMATGKLPDAKDFAQLSPDQQKAVVVENKKREQISILAESREEAQKTLTTLLTRGDAEERASNAPLIKGLAEDIRKYDTLINQLRGININGEKEPVDPSVKEFQERAASTAATMQESKPSVLSAEKEQLQSANSYEVESGKLNRLKSLNLPIPEKVKKYLDPSKGIYPTSFDMSDFKDEDILNIINDPRARAKLEELAKDADTKQSVEGSTSFDNQQAIYSIIGNPSKFSKKERQDAIKSIAKLVPYVLSDLAAGK